MFLIMIDGLGGLLRADEAPTVGCLAVTGENAGQPATPCSNRILRAARGGSEAMALEEYRRKRNFSKTTEPAAGKRPVAKGFSYLIQKHDATRLHYDLRLELDGVLLSWAVTKGPSLGLAELCFNFNRIAIGTCDLVAVSWRSFRSICKPRCRLDLPLDGFPSATFSKGGRVTVAGPYVTR